MAGYKAGSLKSESGFTLIDLLFVCSIIGLLSTLAIPGLMRARGVAQSASAVGTMRVINSAQLSFAVTCGSGFYAADLTTLGIKPPSSFQAFLPPELTSGVTFVKSGYNFSLTRQRAGGRAGHLQRAVVGHDRAGIRLDCGFGRPGGQPPLLRLECGRHDLRGHHVVRGRAARVRSGAARNANPLNLEIW